MRSNHKILPTGIETFFKKNRINVKGDNNPLFDLTIEQFENIKDKRIQSIFVPRRKTINDFFSKFTPC